MTESQIVLRVEAKLAAIDRQGKRAVVTFLMPADEALQLARVVGADCMLGVLVENETPATAN